MPVKALTVNDFRQMKLEKTPFAALTAYDAAFASLFDESGIDMILVGDSLGNVIQGRPTTLPVTLDDMIYHGEIVARAVSRAFVAVDMPFLSFQINDDEAVRNAGTLMKKTCCKGVKLEGGRTSFSKIQRIVNAGIPVIGHVGLTPQSIHSFGGYGVRGKDDRSRVIEDAIATEEAGAFAVVLEKIPRDLAEEITGRLAISTIGIGAGAGCDGQVLVSYDMLGLFRKFKPSFVRRYADLAEITIEGVKQYIEDVRSRSFPSDKESYE